MSYNPDSLPTDIAQANKIFAGASEMLIDSPEMHKYAIDEMHDISDLQKKVDGMRKADLEPHAEKVKEINDRYRAPLDALDGANTHIRTLIGNYQAEQERIAKEQQRQAEEIARKERAEAQAKANAAREEAERQRKAAEESKNLEDRQKATQAAAEAERNANNIEVEAAVTTAPVVAEAPKVKGASIRKKYKAVCTDLPALVAHLAANPVLINLVKLDQSALNKMASAQKEAFKLPGCSLDIQNQVARSRK